MSDEMLELGFITQAQYDEAMADTDAVYERIGLYDIDYQEANATTGSYFSDAVYEQVKQDLILAGYNETMAETLLTSGGLRVESTLDPKIQNILNEEYADASNYPENVKWYLNYALTIISPDGTKNNFSKENMMTWFKQNQNKKFNLIFSSQDDAYAAVDTYRSAMLAQLGVEDNADNYEETISMTPQPQSAMVIEEQNTGYVVAMIGGRGAKEGRRTLNRATSAKRLPGSTFKVVASYAPALDSAGKTLATVYNDAPFNYADGTPVRNWYKTGYRGIQNIRSAIRDSLNIIAVKNITVITPRLGYDYLLNFGFTTLTDGVQVGNEIKSDVNQSLALGGLTYGVTPYELTGAYAAIANGGTYFLTKLGEMPMNVQMKLLRALQENEIMRLGSSQPRKIDVRVIAATNRDLKEMIDANEFRSDLYYRLNVVNLEIPPLRERKKDIIPLAQHFLNQFNAKFKTHKTLSPYSCKTLEEYNWPGNVRELKNTIEKMVILSDEDIISSAELWSSESSLIKDNVQLGNIQLKTILEQIELKYIREYCSLYGTLEKTAEKLDMNLKTLSRRKKHLEEKYPRSENL